MKKNIHFVDSYFHNPTHPITVSLIGCGGTGSQVLTCLGRMNKTLIALGHPGLHVTAYDPDEVSEANIGRQLFSPGDIGLNKAIVLVTRLNRFFETAWEAHPQLYKHSLAANITITCVDNVKSRLSLSKNIILTKDSGTRYQPYMRSFYWLDFGNSANTGQVILGTTFDTKQPKSRKYKTIGKLPCVTERFDLTKVNEKDSGPSCSLAEALEKQDLFINSTLANLGCNLIWKLFREGMIDHSGLYLNLKTMNVNHIPL